MNHELDLRRYSADHHVLWMSMTKVSAGGYRYCDTESTREDSLVVSDSADGPSCKLLLRHSDLYIIGFENDRGQVFGFKEDGPTGPATRIMLGSNYTDLSLSSKRENISRKTLSEAIAAFAKHRGEKGRDLEVPLLSMTLLVSESLRFKSVNERMRCIAAGSGASTQFARWQDTVTAWNSETTVLHATRKLMEKPSQLDVKTWRRFER
jgi:hypothetical protein